MPDKPSLQTMVLMGILGTSGIGGSGYYLSQPDDNPVITLNIAQTMHANLEGRMIGEITKLRIDIVRGHIDRTKSAIRFWEDMGINALSNEQRNLYKEKQRNLIRYENQLDLLEMP